MGINPDPSFLTLNRNYATNPRWIAPEIIVSVHRRNTDPAPDLKRVDLFAFAMLAVEVFTGEVPFGEEGNINITVGIPKNKRPDRPTGAQVGLTNEMWSIIERCWDNDPGRRPPIRDVVRMWPESAQSTNDGPGSVECVQAFH